ncbi:MAG: peptidoglycan DD-metalloendopeptidase family protein [Tannerella sp.]|jgi:septal ring factor EnvC (AmiA/AmiB activator)|nr:peptidoglycan DD-metalloendopeptidase family protein [Tannerella sp.]
MKRLSLVLLLACCATLASSSAQTTGKSGNRRAAKSSRTKTAAAGKVREIQAPAGLYSLQELENQRKMALRDIELTSRLLGETGVDAKNSLNRLNLLSQQLLSRRRILALLTQEMAAIDANIKTVSDEIDILDKDLAKTKENYAKSMRNRLQEHRTAKYKMLLILSAENLLQSYRRMRYLREYSTWQKEEAKRIIMKQNEIACRKAELEKSREDKQTLLLQREQENKKLEDEERIQQTEVRELNRRQKDLQQQLQQKKRDADALNRQIETLIAEDIRYSESDRPATASGTAPKDAKPAAAKSDAAGTSKPAAGYRMTKSELNLSKDFAANKGRLPYPLNGRYTVISSFGEHQHQELSYVRTANNGIDIQTTSGSDALAIFNGVVTRVFVMPGYNNNVIIRHGDYLTVYSNLSQVYVRAGDVVVTRQALGQIFTDPGKGNETILHFQIWKERTKLNPASWVTSN